MTAYLPNKDGEITRCQAHDPNHCPYHVSGDGSPLQHYATREEAMAAYEHKMSKTINRTRTLRKESVVSKFSDYDWENITDEVNNDTTLQGIGVGIDTYSGYITGTRGLDDKLNMDRRRIYSEVRSKNTRNALDLEQAKCDKHMEKPASRRSVDESYNDLVGEISVGTNSIRSMVGSGVKYDVKPIGHDNELGRDKSIMFKVTGTRRDGALGNRRIIYIEDESGRKYEVTARNGAQPSSYYEDKKYEIAAIREMLDNDYAENEEFEDSSMYRSEDKPLINDINEYMHSVNMDYMTSRLMNRWPDRSNDGLFDGARHLKSVIQTYRNEMEEVHYED